MCRSLSSSSSMIPRDSWSISSRSSESVARLYSNRDIALRGPDLCSSVMWLRVMIRDRIFSSLDRAVQPEFFRRWGSGERGSGRGGNCRADGSLSRNDSGWNWTGNRPIVSFHARFYPLERAAGEIFAGAGGGNDFPFVHRLRWWMKMILWEWVIRCWSFSSEKIVFEELIEIWLYISYNFPLECFYWMCGIMEIEISRFICHKFKSFISRLQILQKILLHFTLLRRHRIFKEYIKFLFIYFFFKFNK